MKVEWGEAEIAKQIKAAGGTWNRERKLWQLGWGKVGELGLEGRVVRRVHF